MKTDYRINTINPSKISPDGKWVIVNKTYLNSTIADSTYYINTQDKRKINVTHIQNMYQNLLFDDLVVGTFNKEVIILDANKNKIIATKEQVTKYHTIANKDNNLLITLNNNNALNIEKIDKRKTLNQPLLYKSEVKNYHLSPNKTKLIFYTPNSLNIFDLNTLENTEIKDQSQDISKLYWNNDNTLFAYTDKTNNLLIINIKIKEIKKITLSKEKLERFEVNFYFNNDLFIKYNFKTNKEISHSQYLDIWNGNSRFIYPSNYKLKHQLNYKAFIYQYNENKTIELERTRDKDYSFIDLPNHILRYNPFKLQKFESSILPIQYSLIDINTLISEVEIASYKVPVAFAKNNFVLYKPLNSRNQLWHLYNLTTKQELAIKVDEYSSLIANTNNQEILYFIKEKLNKFNLNTNTTITIANFPIGSKNTILNLQSNTYTSNLDSIKYIYSKVGETERIFSITDNKTILLSESNQKSFSKSLALKGNLTSADNKVFVYTENSFNSPVEIKVIDNNKISTLLKTDIEPTQYNWKKRQSIKYTDRYNKELESTLLYPKDYDPLNKYPMVVYVYNEKPFNTFSSFELPTTVNQTGFNASLLNEQGYFVYFVDSYVNNIGPGISALECITLGVEEILKKEKSIDREKLGLIGHSFGGYKASFIATQTNLFSTIVSGSAAHDLISGLTFRYSKYRIMPDWFMAERAQYGMQKKYSEDPKKYIDNSPLHNAHKAKTPMLLYTGLLDENIHSTNTINMFNALKRENVPTIALFYKNIGHTTGPDTPIEANDLTTRVLDWFDYHLKDKKDIQWIKEGLDYNEYTWSKQDDF
ncbi:prolyl oligopeptidase family serine peptidase [Myroides sp. M-43]|uniref:alpha/beta hydrolase family protein n=1 Tax=Myroides oncorhynchi TaxID=2893756 RepID=UPI001E610DD8|nr:prolyl oligopeptidase family serine peptidase [Myroides oncorhynchi]MCC9041960.1 prolyl oligopeptidase family serine peptidase [Myroides oncorhynchi]